MPELPEIYNIARQMNGTLAGKTVSSVEVRQEKCLNMPADDFIRMVVGKTVRGVYAKGKWLFTRFTEGPYLLVSLGMGGDIIYHEPGEDYRGKCQYLFKFADGSSFHIAFSWFGYVHAAAAESLAHHAMTASLGDDPLGERFTRERFKTMLKGRKGGIKSFLMDQHNVAGIGNVYIQDILFKARLHPNRRIDTLADAEIDTLHDSIVEHLKYAVELGGLKWEHDFFGKPGRYEYTQVGHRPDAPCPVCGTPIEEIRTGSTRSFVCWNCQKL
jgi:formamidopyrimidine-DNA glycosylase